MFEVPPASLWEALSRTEDYPRWWPWLRGFEGGALEAGRTTRCVVRAPLPYSLRFAVDVRDVVPGERVDADVSGDLTGPASLVIAPEGAGSAATLAWEVELRQPVLRAGAVVGRRVMQWGHEWVVDTGVEQFRQLALP